MLTTQNDAVPIAVESSRDLITSSAVVGPIEDIDKRYHHCVITKPNNFDHPRRIRKVIRDAAGIILTMSTSSRIVTTSHGEYGRKRNPRNMGEVSRSIHFNAGVGEKSFADDLKTDTNHSEPEGALENVPCKEGGGYEQRWFYSA